jgi:hypothetical protein
VRVYYEFYKICVVFQGACKDDQSLQDLGSAATAVTRALDDLLQHIKRAGLGGGKAGAAEVRLGFLLGYVGIPLGLFHNVTKNPKIYIEARNKRNVPRCVV